MSTKDSTIVIKGASAVVSVLQIIQAKDGSMKAIVAGTALDANSNPVFLADFAVVLNPGDLPILDQLMATALSKLRVQNGLE